MLFIRAYQHKSLEFCDEAWEYFRNTPEHFHEGGTVKGVNHKIKKSLDCTLFQNNPEPWMKKYEDELFAMFDDYFKFFDIWDVMSELKIDDDKYAMQYYAPGDGFYQYHCEDTTMRTAQRKLTWITYLNDIEEGGGTEFKYQQYATKATKGLTIIFPGSFTHAHRGVVAPKEEKLILTGWVSSFNANQWLDGLQHHDDEPSPATPLNSP